jgi:hypothetical protein
MTSTHLARLLALALFVVIAASSAPADAQRPTGRTPTIFGAHVVDRNDFVIGFSSGWPESSFNMHFGISGVFDIGILLGVTYGRPVWDGDRQDIGFAGRIPLRWTPVHGRIAAFGVRLSPYFLAGDFRGPGSFAGGGDLALLFDIAFPRVLKLILGPEVRTGFASIDTPAGRRTGYDGAVWANFGFEALFSGHVHLGLVLNGGGYWGSGPLGRGGLFRARVNFGYAF